MSGNPMLDRDQLQPEDTLVSEPTGDVLDSGYEPADSTQGRRLDASVEEADRDETIEQRLAQEDPEDPQLPGQPLRRRSAPPVRRLPPVGESSVCADGGPKWPPRRIAAPSA